MQCTKMPRCWSLETFWLVRCTTSKIPSVLFWVWVDNLSDEMQESTDPLIQAFANLRYEGRRLNTNFVQLLSLYRMEDGAYQVNASEVLVDDFLRECQLMHEDVLETRGITIDTDTPNGIYGCFDWDLVMGSLVLSSITLIAMQARECC